MASPLPPDPYEALGVPKDATSAAVKTAHRKLVLKCHPDKVTDPAEKQAAADKFHKIQSAYEILIDESRRERYDAQVRLAELKKEAMARSQSDGRSRGAERSGPSPPYRTAPSEAPRGAYASRGPEPARATPQYEERRPPGYAADYFDPQPRATQRKEPEPERTSRRTAHDVKERFKSAAAKAKSVKEHEKERRREKTRQSDRDTRQERERKYTPFVVDADSDSESDEQEMRSRRMREEDEERRARETYYAQMFKQRREAEEGQYGDERARKLFTQTNDVRDYIASSRGNPRRPEPSDRERERERERERRPSPVRMGSSKDGVEYVKRKDGRPAVMVRRASSKPGKESSSKEKESSRKASSRTPERRSSEERIVEERKPPPLATSKSSPADIHIPEKPRSASVQVNSEAPPIRQMQRSETMPTRRSENTVPTKSSNLRSTELNGGMPTPAPTPDESAVPPPHKFPYGKQYADDNEFATPDGYRTETREPEKPPRPQRPQYTRRTTRSPSPMKEAREPLRDMRESRDSRGYRDPRETPRDRDARDPRSTTHRSTSARNFATTQPPPPNVRTTSYKFNGSGVDPYDNSRPSSGRDTSPREREPSYKYDQRLYGEIPRERDSRPGTGSPRQPHGPYTPPIDEGTNYRRYRPEDIKYSTGYGNKRPSVDLRPSLSRNGSGHASYYQQPVRAS